MGMYDRGSIFGIRIYTFNDFECNTTLYEKKYHAIMTDEQKNEAYVFYTEMKDVFPNKLLFKIRTECITSYNIHNKEPFVLWHPILLPEFVETFGTSTDNSIDTDTDTGTAFVDQTPHGNPNVSNELTNSICWRDFSKLFCFSRLEYK